MKFGPRKINVKSSLKARTTGKVNRKIKRTVNPLYGKKGMGYINDPEKAAYNAVYNKTTFGVNDIKYNKRRKKGGGLLSLIGLMLGIGFLSAIGGTLVDFITGPVIPFVVLALMVSTVYFWVKLLITQKNVYYSNRSLSFYGFFICIWVYTSDFANYFLSFLFAVLSLIPLIYLALKSKSDYENNLDTVTIKTKFFSLLLTLILFSSAIIIR